MAELALLAAVTGAKTGIAIKQANFARKVAEQNAGQAARAAKLEESRFRRGSRRKIGALRAASLAGGRTLRGSPLEILADAAATLEEDALLVRAKGQQRVNAFLIQAEAARHQKQAAIFEGIASFTAGSLLMGGGGATPTPPGGGGFLSGAQAQQFELATGTRLV